MSIRSNKSSVHKRWQAIIWSDDSFAQWTISSSHRLEELSQSNGLGFNHICMKGRNWNILFSLWMHGVYIFFKLTGPPLFHDHQSLFCCVVDISDSIHLATLRGWCNYIIVYIISHEICFWVWYKFHPCHICNNVVQCCATGLVPRHHLNQWWHNDNEQILMKSEYKYSNKIVFIKENVVGYFVQASLWAYLTLPSQMGRRLRFHWHHICW